MMDVCLDGGDTLTMHEHRYTSGELHWKYFHVTMVVHIFKSPVSNVKVRYNDL